MATPNPNAPDPTLPMFSVEHAGLFRRDVADVLASLGHPARVVGGAATTDDGDTFGLDTLARKVVTNPVPPADVIRRHFEEMYQGFEAVATAHGKEDVASDVVLRLMSADVAQSIPLGATRAWAPGLITSLALDMPTSVAAVSADDVSKWGVGEDALYATGMANLRRICADADKGVAPLTLADQRIIFTESESLFHASHALFLNEFATLVEPGIDATGAILFTVPSRHQLAFIQMSSDPTIAARQVTALKVLGEDMFIKAPGPLSPNVYGWMQGNVGQVKLGD